MIHRFGRFEKLLPQVTELTIEIASGPIEFSAGGMFTLDLKHLGSVRVLLNVFKALS